MQSRHASQDQAQSMVRVYGAPGSLYARCGGVFGVAAFVDRCMDKWMADALLNANQAVSTWHQKAQRCGFKFLVVQIVCNLTGGPQRYTGRPMDHAHKHLNISEDEWGRFMELFNEVCTEFGLGPGETGDLNALMISMEEDCVVYPGERAPQDPGPLLPSGNSLYVRLGGVYPIALFVDRLVDALIADSRVQVPCDLQKRNEASLKYLFTEVVCHLAGGPEVVTAQTHDETKLLIPRSQWRILMSTAEVAADHLPAAARPSLLQMLERSKDLVVDPKSKDGPSQPIAVGSVFVKDVQAAAAGKMLSKEAIAARHAAPGAFVAARMRVYGDPRTLYGRGRGVFGLAKLSDQLMEAWMADPLLNANVKVARWHESQQKCGFKFLVTQIMGYLTGGPQRYTGRSMEEAHKHLVISTQEWNSFMMDAANVFQRVGMEERTQQELVSILSGFQSQCVVKPGEAVQADPGSVKPQGARLYHRLGGVYPIAQFANRLVDLVLAGTTVHVACGSGNDPAATRHPAGLKYVFTELVANGTGGPEVVTSKGFDDAKLGVQVEEWPAFLALAAEAAEVWPSPHMRNALLATLGELKAEICMGLISEENATLDSAKRQKLQAAGFDHYLSEAALDKCDGDVDQALQLLASCWTPEGGMALPSTSTLSVESLPTPARCPFSGQQASPEGGRCPFAPAGSASASALPAGHPPIPAPVVAPPGLDDRLLSAAKALMERGMTVADVAQMLGVEKAALSAAVAQESASMMAGRALNSRWQERLDTLTSEDPELCCPVSLVLFTDPVIASDGFMYEKASLEGLLRARMTSPMTREPLKKEFIPARQRKSDTIRFRESRIKELLKFAAEALAPQPRMAAVALERASEYLEVLGPDKVPTLAREAARLLQQAGLPVPQILRVSPPAAKPNGLQSVISSLASYLLPSSPILRFPFCG
mmetsp:Transcript_28210/g.58661  ORF Transcript_28210/g.58661 Transcript_28210/m.58661 type:complete len:936 (+) Transcript_28210:88-2895(+)